MLRAVPMPSVDYQLAALENCAEALAAMRAAGVQVRFKRRDETMLWKPKFDRLPQELQMLIRNNARSLAVVLVPHERGGTLSRPGWHESDGLVSCVGCGETTAVADPLGTPRHQWCGWLGQVKRTTSAR